MNNKTYLRVGKRFVPIPNREKIVGMYFNELSDGNPFLTKEATSDTTTGIVVDVKDGFLIVADHKLVELGLKEISKIKSQNSNKYIPSIEDLLSAAPYIYKMHNRPVQIWSSTITKNRVFCLYLNSDYCYMGNYDVDYYYHSLNIQFFYKIPLQNVL